MGLRHLIIHLTTSISHPLPPTTPTPNAMVRISIIYANKNIKTTLIDYFDSKIVKVNETSVWIEEGVRKKRER